MGVVRHTRRHGEAAIVVDHEDREKGVGLGRVGDPDEGCKTAKLESAFIGVFSDVDVVLAKAQHAICTHLLGGAGRGPRWRDGG